MSLILLDSYRILNEQQSNRLFNMVFTASQIFGISAVLSVTLWMGSYEDGGFGWSDNPEKQFHYHPTFMAMGMLFLYGEAIIVYRVFRNERKRFTKLLHLVTHSIALVFAAIALKAVLDSHDYHRDPEGEISPIPNFYSLHSWVGIFFLTAYVLQYLGGFLTFFFPGMSMEVRKFFLPFHQLFGVLILIGFTAGALMGISERAAWKHTCWTKDKQMCGEQLLANFFGLCLVGYSSSIVFLVMNPRWKRQPLPEEEFLQPLEAD
ncbi:eukaryotic cytochrome b561 domain-containing protein [Ditylenchus destructor]|nr:eukaryotic cytochrome b561 domain-containing protein [Ditylenchus destructor]